MNEFMKTDEVARYLGVSRGRVSQLAVAGSIPSVRRGRTILIPVTAWNAWLADQNRIALDAVKGGRNAETITA